MKTSAAVIAVALALLVSWSAPAAPLAQETVSCAQVWGSFNVQLIGDRDWGWNLGGLGSVGAPRKKALIVVWSLGGFAAQQGLNVYSWTTATRSRMSNRCRAIKQPLKEPSSAGLGPVIRVKDGWAFGRNFICLDKGRLLISAAQRGGRTHVVVRMQGSGRVIAVGELGAGGGWIRGSKRCESKEK